MDFDGDLAKRTPECIQTGIVYCKNMEFKQGWETESYNCPVCGARYKLYYEDMA